MSLLVWSVCVCACGLLFLLGALSYQATDRELPPGTSAALQVQQVTVTEDMALAALQESAEQNHVNLMRVGANPAGPDAPPWYFAFVGDQELFDSTYPGGDYPAFSPASVPQIFTGEDIEAKNQPIRGLYAVQGGGAGSSAMAAELTGAGLATNATAVDPASNYLAGLLQSSLWPLLVTAVIALALSIVYWVASSRKATALQQFHGYTRTRIVLGQTASLLAVFAAAVIATTAVGSAILVVFNGGNQYFLFLPWALTPMFGLGIAAVATQLVASRGVLGLPAYAALKGARPRRLLALTAGLAQAVMLILVFGAVAQAAGGAVVLAQDTRSFGNWSIDQDSVSAQINPNAFEDPSANTFEPDVAAAYESFGSIFEELDNAGTAILSAHQTDQDTGAPDAPLDSFAPLEGNSMIVNNNYLARHDVLDEDGAPVKDVTPGLNEITLLIPERLASQQDELVTMWSESTLAASDPIGRAEPTEPYAVIPLIVANGQQLFNYGTTQDMQRWVQTSPVVAVVSPDSHYISDYILLGVAANNGNVIFADADRFRQLADASGLTERFSGVNSPAAHAAQQLRDRETQLIVAVGTAIAGGLTLIITVGLLAAIYADATRFPSFLRRIHGRSAIRIHGLFVASVICASGLMILTGVFVSRLLDLATEPTLRTVAVAMICLVGAAVLVATLSLDRRARANLIKRR